MTTTNGSVTSIEFDGAISSHRLSDFAESIGAPLELRDHDRYYHLGARTVHDSRGGPNSTFAQQLQAEMVKDALMLYLPVERRLDPQRQDFRAEALHQLDRLSSRHPVQRYVYDPLVAGAVDAIISRAFDLEIIPNDGGGSHIWLHFGKRSELPDKTSGVPYFRALQHVPELAQQGHGVRSFCSILLALMSSKWAFALVDEPEMFLHPPQAQIIGQILGSDQIVPGQVFVATHSADVLHGILSASGARTKIMRFTRKGSNFNCRSIPVADARRLQEATGAHSKAALDAFFHDRTILCEGEFDARFYGALTDAMGTTESGAGLRDVLFFPCGGKQRMPAIARTLVQLGIDVRVICDFDALREEQTISGLVLAAGGDWTTLRSRWRAVCSAIESRTREDDLTKIRDEGIQILTAATVSTTANEMSRRIRALWRRLSGWELAKAFGIQSLSGEPHKQCLDLVGDLEKLGIYVTPWGELENLDRAAGGASSKSSWLDTVLEKNLAVAEELESARRVLRGVLS
ncbi:MAG: ATP-dependent endonuclease [Reyranellaceae bacterium]